MAERRLSSIPGPATSGLPTGRLSMAGRPSLGPARLRPPASVNNTAVELAGMTLQGGIGTNSDSQGKLSLSGRASLNPRESLNRRSSSFGAKGNNLVNVGGSGGNALLAVGPGMKDPRPIREKAYQLEVIKNLINFLAKAGYPHPISQKILTAPSAKDFQNIFRFLYAQLDPTYDVCAGGKKFEEEVPVLMKGLRYPFAGEISKSQLYAVGSIHAWPGLLAMLGWMVDLITCCEVLQTSRLRITATEEMSAESIFMSDSDKIGTMGMNMPPSSSVTLPKGNSGERLFFDYLCKAYKLFLAGNDDFDDLVSDLSANFEKQNENVLQEIEDLRTKINELECEYQNLASEERPLIRSQRELGIYQADIEKFRKFIAHLELKKDKFHESIAAGRTELLEIESALSEAEGQRATLQAQVDAQAISVEEIDKLNEEREALQRTLESLQQAKEEATRLCWDRELALQKRIDDVEKLVNQYGHKTEQLGLVATDSDNLHGRISSLQFNPNTNKADELLTPNLREVALPSLHQFRGEILAKLHDLQTELLSVQENLDKLKENYQDRAEELQRQEKKLEKLTNTYTELKEGFAAEDRKVEEEAERLDQSIQRMRAEINGQTIAAQQRFQRATIEYDQLVTQVAAEKESVGGELYRILEDLINFKTLVEASLEDLDVVVQKEIA